MISAEFFILSFCFFAAVLLLASIRSLHCPYWQLPLGLSFFIGGCILTFVFALYWFATVIAVLSGIAGAAAVIVINERRKPAPVSEDFSNTEDL